MSTAGGWRRPPLLVLAFAWLAGYAVLYAALGIWFPRQAYSMLPALGVFLAACLAGSVQDFRERPVRLAAELLPQVVLFGMLFAGSPALAGPNATRMQNWGSTERLLLRLRSDLPSVPAPAAVHLVLPYREQQTRFNPLRPHPPQGEPPPGFVRLCSRWLSTVLENRGIRVEEYMFIRKDDAAAGFRLVGVSGGPAILFPEEGTYYLLTRAGIVGRVAHRGEAVPLAPPPSPPGVRSYVYVWDDSSGGLIGIPNRF